MQSDDRGFIESSMQEREGPVLRVASCMERNAPPSLRSEGAMRTLRALYTATCGRSRCWQGTTATIEAEAVSRAIQGRKTTQG